MSHDQVRFSFLDIAHVFRNSPALIRLSGAAVDSPPRRALFTIVAPVTFYQQPCVDCFETHMRVLFVEHLQIPRKAPGAEKIKPMLFPPIRNSEFLTVIYLIRVLSESPFSLPDFVAGCIFYYPHLTSSFIFCSVHRASPLSTEIHEGFGTQRWVWTSGLWLGTPPQI